MTRESNENVSGHAFPSLDDVTIGELLSCLADHPTRRLTFRYAGKTIDRGYHVTEVKAGKFAALDCGANPEAWTEIFIQLWDVADAPTQMTAGKFVGIIHKVTDHLALDMTAKLTFEVSDSIRAMQLHRASGPVMLDDEFIVELSPRSASCKPRDRWLTEQSQTCCDPQTSRCCA